MAGMAMADTYTITKGEHQQMLKEADDWMDDMPDGLQDRLSDAVSHAEQGILNEIAYFRNLGDTVGEWKYPVDIKNIKGGKGGNMALRLYTPKNKKSQQPLPLLIYYHGGGWTVGSLNSVDKFCRALVSEGNVMVVSVDYPLAPEHKSNEILQETVETTEWIWQQGKNWNFNPQRISLGGDGAGGNIALEVYNLLPQTYKVRSLVVYYPIIYYNKQLDPSSKRTYGRGYGFDSRLWEAFVAAYNPSLMNLKKTLPATLLISSGKDILIEEERELSKVNNVNYVEFSNAIHGFISDGHQPTAFNKAVAITDQFLK